jgi:hypothetical protein
LALICSAALQRNGSVGESFSSQDSTDQSLSLGSQCICSFGAGWLHAARGTFCIVLAYASGAEGYAQTYVCMHALHCASLPAYAPSRPTIVLSSSRSLLVSAFLAVSVCRTSSEDTGMPLPNNRRKKCAHSEHDSFHNCKSARKMAH